MSQPTDRPVRVVTSMATAELVSDLLGRDDRSGPACTVESMGGVAAAERIRSGNDFDVAVLGSGALAKLRDDGHLASDIRPLADSDVMVAVPAGEPAPAIGSADQVWAAIRDAQAVGYSTGPSGTALVDLIDGWGGTGRMRGELVQAQPGVPVASLLADRQVSLGFQQASELADKPGIDVIGPMPDDCAIRTTFAAAVLTSCADRARADEVVAELTSPEVAQLVRDHHMSPPQATKEQ